MTTHVPKPLKFTSTINSKVELSHKPAPVIIHENNTTKKTVAQHVPKPTFKSSGFDINNIDPLLIPLIIKYGDFTTAEQARISYIVNTEFKDVLIKKVDHSGAEQQVTHSKKSHEILLECLQNNIINETNVILTHILDIITNKHKDNAWENFFFIVKKEEEPDIGTIITLLDIDVDRLKEKVSRIQKMINLLGDAIFHTTQEYKSLKLYYVAGECRVEQLNAMRTTYTATSDPLLLMQQVDDKHNYDLFVRKINSFKALVEYIMSSLMQAQALQNILESMIANIETMLEINIPAFKQQLLYANSFKSLKKSPVFVTKQTTLINNINSIIEYKE
jgi:hypothetical protein